jgi:hypothetical protein
LAKKAKKLPPEMAGKELMWPPPGGIPFAVSSVDNWWDVADAANRTNVWDVILFNFDTLNALEINYYMRTLLKCYATKKGNWLFGQEDGSDSVLYLPPTNWKWVGVGQPQAPVRPAMGVMDAAMAAYAYAVLKGPITAHIAFSQGPYTIIGSDFARIADRIANGTIAVYGTEASSGRAKYVIDEQALYIRRSYDPQDTSMIIHEAVHAVFDLEKRHNILTKEDEAMGYLAQTIWIQELLQTDRKQLGGGEAAEIYMEAFKLWYDKYRPVEELTYQDFIPLQNTIAANGHYGSSANDVAEYDGMYEFAAVK